jgi:hypothetical protein
MKQRLLLLFFISCALCLMGSALVVCETDMPRRLPLPPSAPVLQVFCALPAPAENSTTAAQPAFAGEILPVIGTVQPVLPSSDANGTPLAAGRHFKAAYTAFHYSDRAG